MTKLEKAKQIIEENFYDADCGIFDSRNWVGDPMVNIFVDDELQIDICYNYSYFEVFGLNETDFKELSEFYNSLGF
jgi:hypothetical protein